jgi:hypothetical protein
MRTPASKKSNHRLWVQCFARGEVEVVIWFLVEESSFTLSQEKKQVVLAFLYTFEDLVVRDSVVISFVSSYILVPIRGLV